MGFPRLKPKMSTALHSFRRPLQRIPLAFPAASPGCPHSPVLVLIRQAHHSYICFPPPIFSNSALPALFFPLGIPLWSLWAHPDKPFQSPISSFWFSIMLPNPFRHVCLTPSQLPGIRAWASLTVMILPPTKMLTRSATAVQAVITIASCLRLGWKWSPRLAVARLMRCRNHLWSVSQLICDQD